jgi:hypothetical protein
METKRFDVIFESEKVEEKELIEAFKEFIKKWNGELKLYTLEDLKSYEELLGL